MKEILQQKLTGERALFHSSDLKIVYSTFEDGESPLKECQNLEIDHCIFKWKYPLWYCKNVEVNNSTLLDMARAGIWYSDHVTFRDTTVEAPKAFRRTNHLTLERVTIPNASETLWNCREVVLKDVSARGDYFAMGSENMEIEDFNLNGNYSFDGCKNLTLRRVKLVTKDAFWNCENVTVYDSTIIGEYLGWNSKNVKLVRCVIDSLQGLCYMDNVVLEDCVLLNTNLAFEYSTVDATVCSVIDSVKNPISGRITAKGIGELIMEEDIIDPTKTEIKIEQD